jgi:ABC-type branched-subunit amino acid transport system ATPase component/ABC-type branched-subunit amino acid transport system permease subunit
MKAGIGRRASASTWKAWGLLGLGAVLPLVVGNEFYLYLIQVICVYATACIGLNILAGYGGLWSFGHGALFGIGAYAFALASTRLEWSFGMALGLALGAGAVSGLILSIPAMRVRGYYLGLITLAFSILLEQWLVQWEGLTGGWNGISGIRHPTGGIRVGAVDGFYYLVLTLCLVGYVLGRNVVASKWGRRLQCIRGAEVVAGAMGIDAYRTKLAAFVLSSAYAGLAGALYAGLIGFISPDSFDVGLSIFFFLAVVMGGMGSLAGPLTGVALLFLLPQVFLVGLQGYRLLVYGVIMIIVAGVLPDGITGAFRRRWGQDRPTAVEPPGSAGAIALGRERPAGGNLRLEQVTKRFAGVLALADVSLEVAPGECCAVIGPNGSGKTTLLNVISGLHQPDGGEIWFRDRRIDRMAAHRICAVGVSRTFQSPRVMGELTVEENIMLGADPMGRASLVEGMLRLPRSRDEERRGRARARALAAFVGIDDWLEAPGHTLTHGHQRLVELARALASTPAVLLLDEPAAGLAAEEIRRFGAVLHQIVAAGVSVILIEHRVELVMEVANTVWVLDGGRVIASGSPRAVAEDPVVIEAYLGSTAKDVQALGVGRA